MNTLEGGATKSILHRQEWGRDKYGDMFVRVTDVVVCLLFQLCTSGQTDVIDVFLKLQKMSAPLFGHIKAWEREFSMMLNDLTSTLFEAC